MLRTRVLSAVGLIPVVALVLLAGEPWLGLLVLIVAGLAAREAFALLKEAGVAAEPVVGIVIALVLVGSSWLLGDRLGEVWLLAGVGIVVAAVGATLRFDPREGFQIWLGTVFGALYIGLLAFLLLIVGNARGMPASAPLAAWLDGGRGWLLVGVLAVWAYDTGAYFAGRTFGRRSFMAHISPLKTWEGVAGGIVLAVIVTFVTLWAVGGWVPGALVLGPAVGVAAQVGDLAESMLKRAAGAKDSGTLIPGHGGMLDRIDSILFAGPVVYFYLILVGAAG
ncbi:MAG: phosphatidate cytidylyltransferase [Candidatus Limnocylindrales bacterium]